MKTNKFFGLAAIVCGFALSFTSCSKEDNPIGDISDIIPETEEYLISFEKQSLNADGYWCGDKSGTPFENWGATGYSCFYTESDTKFTANFTPAWASWSGFAISNRTATTFNSATMTPDQFNCIAGGAHGGDNFCVVYPFGESIDFEVPVTLKGFWYTNNAWTVDAILNGDGMSPGKFEADDWLSCYLTPTPADGSLGGARYEISLAKGSDYVKEWKYCDLSDVAAFKNISSISFGFGGSKANDYGLTTPTYICIDDMVIEK